LIFLQAFPLSFSILWRFVLVFPVLVVGLLLYGFLGGLIGALVGMVLAGAGAIILIAVSASSGIIPILVGARMGFAARQVWPSAGYKKLILPALAYGSTEALAVGLLLIPSSGLLALFAMPDLTDLSQPMDTDALRALTAGNSPLATGISGLTIATFFAICAIRACLLVPIASASIGRDPDQSPCTPFRHFGATFWSQLALVATSYLALTLIYFVVFLILLVTGGIEVITMALVDLAAMIGGTQPWKPIWPLIGLLAGYIVTALWAFSLQCAGGILGYLSLSGPFTSRAVPPPAAASDLAASESGPRLSQEELRALRKSRQTGG